MESFWGSTSLTILNTSFQNRTSEPDNPQNFASAYLQSDVIHRLWLIVPPVLLLLGCYGNVMTIVVMRAMRTSESTSCLSVYFTALAVSDLILLGTTMASYWPEMAFNLPLAYFHDLTCSGLLFVTTASSMTSAWLLVTMTSQRLMSVVVPHRVSVLCTARRGKLISAAIAVISCVINVHFFLNYHVETTQEGYKSCVSKDKGMVDVLGTLTLFLMSFIPFLLLIVINSLLIYRVLRSNQTAGKLAAGSAQLSASRSAQLTSMTTTLVFTSLAFLMLTLPSCVFNLYLESIGYFEGEIEDEDLTIKLAWGDSVCILLWASNSAINFYIYVLSGGKFRQEVRRCFCPDVKRTAATA
ncbi:hypothetical protein ACOMHN_038404 [Nucella lapillus]